MAFINDEYDKFDKKMTEIEQKRKLEKAQQKAAQEAANKAKHEANKPRGLFS